MDKELIKANLHLHAVLPRLEELLRLDDEAKTVAKDMNVTIRFVVKGGPTVQIVFKNGVAKANLKPVGKNNIGLLFLSCEQLNRMFNGEKVIPIPYKGIHRIKDLKAFTRLTELLTKYLKPTDADMTDPSFKKKAVEMSLMTGLNGARVIAEFDTKMKKVADKLPSGTIEYNILPDGPQAHVIVERGHISAYNGPINSPTGTLEINGVDLAADLFANKVDSFAVLGAGDLRASGLLPLIDEFSALSDRVALYLN